MKKLKERKLRLHRETLKNLSHESLTRVVGGGTIDCTLDLTCDANCTGESDHFTCGGQPICQSNPTVCGDVTCVSCRDTLCASDCGC